MMDFIKKHIKDFISFLILFVPAIIFVNVGNYVATGIFAGLSITFIIFLNFEKILKLKAFGIEVELKEKIEKAYATIDLIKEISQTEIKALLNLTQKRRYIHNNDIDGIIQIIDNTIKLINDGIYSDNLLDDCKYALSKVIGMHLNDMIILIDDSEEIKMKLLGIYKDDITINIIRDGKKIPSEIIFNNLTMYPTWNRGYYNDYKKLLNCYRRHFGENDISVNIV